MSRALLSALLALCLYPSGVHAAGPYRFKAFVQPTSGITEADTVRLILQVEGPDAPQLAPPRLSKLTNLKLVAGPDRQFNSVWNNGRFFTTSKFTYTLLPLEAGPAEIPLLRVEVGSQVFETGPIRFDVAAAPGGAPPARAAPQGTRRETEGPDVFLTAELGVDEAWVGQSIPLEVSLYSGEAISGMNWVSLPKLGGFWVETIDVDADAERFERTVSGRRYTVFPVRLQVLVPQTAGEFEIEPFTAQLQVRQRRSGDPFDFFSIGRTRTVVRKSEALKLQVRSVPDRGRPEGFSGAVGAFKMRVGLDRSETEVNQAVALKATVEGDGFLRSVTPPVFEMPPDVKVFDPKVTQSFGRVGGKPVARKTWEWVLVPLVQGEFELPELAFHYFDPATETFRAERVTPATLVVRRNGQAATEAISRGDIQLQRRDLQFIKEFPGRLGAGDPRAHRGRLFLVLAALPWLWVPVAVLIGRRRAHGQRNRSVLRARKARSQARKRLRAARKRLGQAGAGFHEEVARALVEYVADRFDRSAAGMTYELADELLASRGLDAELRRRFRACLETCDFARFVPATGESARQEEVHGEALALIDALDRAW